MDKYPPINHVNYKFKQFMFNYDPKKRAIADRFKKLIPINNKVFVSSNMNNIAYENSVPFLNGVLKIKIKKLKKLFNIGGLKNAYQQNKTK